MNNNSIFQQFAPQPKTTRAAGTNAVIYTRVSHVSQEENTSLESQKKYCEQFADRKGLKVVEYFGGTYESAKTDDRKEFNKMLAYIKKSRNIDAIIVYSYERFSRTGIDGAKIAQDLSKKHGILTLSVTQDIDTQSVSGVLLQNMMFLLGQMDNEQRRDKTVTGMREITRKGFTPGAIPRGYVNLNKGGRAVDQKIVLNDDGKLLQKAFLMKQKNYSNSLIVKELQSMGCNVDERRLCEIFKNPYYCGILVNKLIPGEAIDGNHEPMVSKKMFLEINNVVPNGRNAVRSLDDDKLPLKRFMKCAKCSTPMTGYENKIKHLHYYKCRNNECSQNINAKRVHEQFLRLVQSFEIKPKLIPILQEKVLERYEKSLKNLMESNSVKKRKLSELVSEIEDAEKRHFLGKLDGKLYDKFMPQMLEEKYKLEKALDRSAINSSNLKKVAKSVLDICRNPSEIWESGTNDKRLKLQTLLFPQGIAFDKENDRVLTFRINALFEPIVEVARKIGGIKNGDHTTLSTIPAMVTSSGVKPETFRAVI